MSSYRQILYHIVFRTKGSRKSISKEDASELYAYISGIIKNKKCHLYRINGIENHIHMLSDLHPDVSLSAFMRDIKTAASFWLKRHKKFKNFEGWAEGYAALTASYSVKDSLIEYIKNQHEHHRRVSFEEEYKQILEEAGIEINLEYFP